MDLKNKIKIPPEFLEALKKARKEAKKYIKDKERIAGAVAGVIVLGIILIIAIGPKKKETVEIPPVPEKAVVAEKLTKEFGRRQALVSLVTEKPVRDKAISGHYGYYASLEIIKKWQADPENAPGRHTADPWPGEIEVEDVIENEDGSFTVTGSLIELTFQDGYKDGIYGKYPVEIIYKDFTGRLLITSYEVTREEEEALEE